MENKARRAYIAWEENDEMSSDSDNEEQAHLGLMVKSIDSDSEVSSSQNSNTPSYNELLDAFNELLEKSLEISQITSKQREKIVCLEKENNSLKNEILSIKDELTTSTTLIQKLQRKIASLEKDERIKESAKSLCTILKNQKYVSDKRGLGFVPPKRKRRKSTFKRSNKRNHDTTSKSAPKVSHPCTYCNHTGHYYSQCYFRKKGVPSGKFIWIVKQANPSGPKIVWVPETV